MLSPTFFSVASALTYLSITASVSARVAPLLPRQESDDGDGSFVCQGGTYNDIFMSVGMGDPNSGAQVDLERFCRSWIDIPVSTSYVLTFTPTTTVYADTVTANITTQQVYSATSTLTETVYETGYALPYWEDDGEDEQQAESEPPAVTARAVLPRDMEIKARQAASSDSKSLDVSSLGSALSSACSCKMYSPLPLFDTLTADPATRLISATRYRPITVNQTVPGGETTVTTTVKTTSIIEPTVVDTATVTGTDTVDSSSSTDYSGNGTLTSSVYYTDESTIISTDTATVNATIVTATGGYSSNVSLTSYPTDVSTSVVTDTVDLNRTSTVPYTYTYPGTAGTGYPLPSPNSTYCSSCYPSGVTPGPNWPASTVTEIERITVSIVTVSKETVTVTRAVSTVTLSAATVTLTDDAHGGDYDDGYDGGYGEDYSDEGGDEDGEYWDEEEEYEESEEEPSATADDGETEVRTEVTVSTETVDSADNPEEDSTENESSASEGQGSAGDSADWPDSDDSEDSEDSPDHGGGYYHDHGDGHYHEHSHDDDYVKGDQSD